MQNNHLEVTVASERTSTRTSVQIDTFILQHAQETADSRDTSLTQLIKDAMIEDTERRIMFCYMPSMEKTTPLAHIIPVQTSKSKSSVSFNIDKTHLDEAKLVAKYYGQTLAEFVERALFLKIYRLQYNGEMLRAKLAELRNGKYAPSKSRIYRDLQEEEWKRQDEASWKQMEVDEAEDSQA
jgi:hypothetical protein